MELIIRITDDEAQQLYHTSTHCFYHEQNDRFEFINKDDEKSNIMDTFDKTHTMHFCDNNIVNAILIKNYFAATNVKCVILWDMAEDGYAIVTDQIWNDYLNKKDTSMNIGENNEHVDEKIKINI